MALAIVLVDLDVEAPEAPPVQQHHCQHHDHQADGRLRVPLQGLGQVRAVEHDREAEHEEAGSVAEAPDEAEPGRASRRALLAGCDERRHRGEVVGIRRVAQPEHERDDDDHEQCRAIGHSGDPVVEAEHHVTFGIAWTVISTPAMRITAALSAGSPRSTRPSNFARANMRFASTATRPTPVIDSASPRLNATISNNPNATRCSEIAASRTTSADGHGSSPPETPTAKSERKPGESSSSWW